MFPDAIPILMALQCFHVLLLGVHDWIPLGPLNELAAARAMVPQKKLLLGTFITASAFACGLPASIYYRPETWPKWLFCYLAIRYLLLLLGRTASLVDSTLF